MKTTPGVRTHTTTSLLLDERHLARLNELAQSTGLSSSAVMRLLIDNSRIGRVTRNEPMATIGGKRRSSTDTTTTGEPHERPRRRK